MMLCSRFVTYNAHLLSKYLAFIMLTLYSTNSVFPPPQSVRTQASTNDTPEPMFSCPTSPSSLLSTSQWRSAERCAAVNTWGWTYLVRCPTLETNNSTMFYPKVALSNFHVCARSWIDSELG